MSDVILPPHNEEAEKGILGSILMDSERVMPMMTKVSVSGEHFFFKHNQLLYSLISNLYASGVPIDEITVMNESSKLGIAGIGFEYIEDITGSTPTSAHAEYYLEILCDRFARRKVIEKANESISVALDLEVDSDSVVSKAEESLHELRVEDRESKEAMRIEILNDYDLAEKGIVAGVITPFDKMDKETGGIPLKAVTPFIGRSGSGKSMVKAAWEARLMLDDTGFLDCAMEDKSRAMSRLAGNLAKASDFHLRKGSACDGQRERVNDMLKRITASKLANFRSKKRDIMGVCSQIRYHADAFGIKIAFIDGFKDIARPAKYHNDTGYEEHLSQMLCDCAETCGVAIVPIIHLKKIEKDKYLEDGDMRGSSLLNSDARCLLALQDSGINDQFSEAGLILQDESRIFDMLKNNYGTRVCVPFDIDFNMQSVIDPQSMRG